MYGGRSFFEKPVSVSSCQCFKKEIAADRTFKFAHGFPFATTSNLVQFLSPPRPPKARSTLAKRFGPNNLALRPNQLCVERPAGWGHLVAPIVGKVCTKYLWKHVNCCLATGPATVPQKKAIWRNGTEFGAKWPNLALCRTRVRGFLMSEKEFLEYLERQ
eukprot:g5901.t1